MTLLTCPRCSTVLDRVAVQATEVDRCGGCGCVWLDRGELGALLAVEPTAVAELVNAGGHAAAPPLHGAIVLDCPACEGKLQTLDLGQVRVDRCTACQGLLFDNKGLEPGLALLRAEAKKRGA
ncbi:MAG: zf-TFIIB domain-containing protein [Pseudomonadota bacterium]